MTDQASPQPDTTPQPPAKKAGKAPPAPAGKPRRSRRRKWAFRAAAALLLLTVIACTVVVHYTRPKNLKPLLEGVLSREIGGEVTIGRATLTRGGLLTLDALWVDVPNLPADRDEFAKLFEAESVSVQLNFDRLWRGELRVDDIRIQQPQLHIIEDLDAQELNLEMLAMRPSDADKPFKLRLPPAINLHGARIRFAQIADGKLQTLEAMRLEGELRENAQQKRLYDFELRQYDASANLDATLSGSVDTERPSLHVNLAGFRVDTAHRQFVPPGFRAFWDELQPTGRLPNLSIALDSGADGRLRLEEAVLELDDVAITPPYAELGRPLPEDVDEPAYAPRMTRVSGRFIVDRQSVQVENLTGIIEGIRYYASGRWGLADEAAGTIAVSTDPFTLDENPRFLASLPIVGVKIFERIQPSGRFQASTKFTRAGDGEPVEVSGVIKLLEARGRYHKFPFPISNLRGVITFDRDRVRLENLSGDGPNGGTVTIRGEIAPPADGAAVRIAVEARAVPFDDALMDAFSAKRRKSVEQFFDPNLHRGLVEEGVIRASDPALAAASPIRSDADVVDGEELPPVFDLGGAVDVDVLIDRAFGDDAKYEVTTTVDAAGASALFKHWPYPLTGESGQIIVGPGGIEMRDVVMVGPTGGRGVIRGTLLPDPGDKTKYRPDLRIEEADLPLDKLLRHSIRVGQRQVVEDLHATGRLVGSATVIQPEDADKTQWQVDAEIVGGVVQPYAGDFRIQNVGGRFTLGNTGLELNGITANRGSAALTVGGWFKWGPGGNGFRLEADGRDLVIEPALLDLLPPDEPARQQLAALQETHRPSGITHARLVWEKAVTPREAPPAADAAPEAKPDVPPPTLADAVGLPRPKRSTYTLTVEPQNFGLDFRGDRLEFTDMAGRATVRPGQIDLNQLAAQFSTGRTEIDGLVGLDGVTPTALTLTATADAHCPYTRKFLPDNAVDVLDALEVSGDFRLTDARLLIRPEPREEQADLEFDGRVALVDTGLRVGVPITQMRGRLEVGVRRFPGQRRPQLSFDLQADHLRAADRRVAPLTVRLDNHEDAEYLTFNEVLGGVYGGIMVGSGRVPLEPAMPYRFDITLSDVEVDPFLKPAASDPTQQQTPVVLAAGGDFVGADNGRGEAGGDRTPVPFSNLDRDLSSGLMSASLSIEAPLDDASVRRGRGAMTIRDAKLYNRPLTTALLRATNFSLPSGDPLNTASARYLVDGDTVRFDELTFGGPSLTIAGAGTMSLPGTELNLMMVSRNSDAPRLGPLSDLIDLFKDELIAFRVTGTLESPSTNVTTLRGIQKGWQDIFGVTKATLSPGDNNVGE